MMILAMAWLAVACSGPGDLDSSFDSDGKATTAFGPAHNMGKDLVVQEDRKIVVAGEFENSPSDTNFALARYNPDGALDTSFGSDGKVVTSISSGGDNAFALAVQPDRKLVVAGFTDNGPATDFALVRYDPNGSLDTSFSDDGKLITDLGSDREVAFDVAVQEDGKVVAAGYSWNGNPLAGGTDDDIALARYNPDGSLDPTFSGDGKVITDFVGYADRAHAVAVEPNGKIVVAGSAASDDTGNDDFALARYDPDGSLDPTFGDDGKVVTHFGYSSAFDVAVQKDEKLVAAGFSSSRGTGDDFALAHYNPNGSLDATFSGDGKLATSFGSDDQAQGLAIQSDGKIVAAGYAPGSNKYLDFALVRYEPDGSLDTSFHNDGKVTTDFSGHSDQAEGVTTQDDGKIVAAGYAHSTHDSSRFAVARYLGDDN